MYIYEYFVSVCVCFASTLILQELTGNVQDIFYSIYLFFLRVYACLSVVNNYGRTFVRILRVHACVLGVYFSILRIFYQCNILIFDVVCEHMRVFCEYLPITGTQEILR